ncbi:rod shape-determining protein MreC [soil metagenome]
MRNLLSFFIRYNSFFIFFALEVICLASVFRLNYYHKVTFVNAANDLSGSIYSSYSNFTDYLSLADVNDSLSRENALLRSQLQGSYWNTEVKKDVACDVNMVQAYQYFDAKIISNSTNSISNYLVINKGRKHGVRENMGVVVSNGVVGIVMDVSENFATIMSVLHKDSKISVKIKSFNNYTGSLIWLGGDSRYAIVKQIPKHVKFAVGDSVVTSGYSSIFPENILVGSIESFEIPSGSNFYDISIKLAADLETIEYVYVINYLYSKEQGELQQKRK